MSVFPGLGGWINQNIQQPPKVESKRSNNVKSNSQSEKDTNLKPWYDEPGKNESMKPGHPRSKSLFVVDPKYYDLEEVTRQVRLWIDGKPKLPWYDAPAKVKVKTKKGLCHMNIEFTLGWPPQATYEMLTNPRDLTFFREDETGQQLLENKSTKVLKKDGPRQITDVEKALRWKLFCLSGVIPIHLIIDENHQNLTAKYKKDKMKFMKVLEGSWKVEPLYADQERFCKSRTVNSQEEYKKCSGGRGRIASKVSISCGPNFDSEMSVFPGFGSWINQNIQQPPKGESMRSENVKSNSESEMDTNRDEKIKQLKLWSKAEKKHPWYDPPPKVKVTMKKGICHMNIELTLGVPPDGAYELFTNPTDVPFFKIDKSGRQLLENKTRKVLKKDGPRQIVKVEKAVAWDFLWWSGSLPINLIVDENKKDLEAKYKKEKMMFMKVFEGSWKIEPLYVDSERLCKQMKPKNREEYEKCSGGQGKIASKVTMDQYFQPYPLLNLPPLSSHIRKITIKTTTTLLKMLQDQATILREMPYS